MAWTKVKRLRVTSDEPSVTLKPDRISFNVVFVKLAELEKFQFVRIYFDEEDRKLGFEFLKEQEDTDVFRLVRVGSKGFWCASRDVLDKIWVRKVAQSPGANVFPAKKDGKIWAIALIPAFEYATNRTDANRISAEVSGIYRYVNASGDVVYIGKGNVRARLAERKREDWIFEKIEYSIIHDDTKALEWESFWMDYHKEQNNGELPKYNLIAGRTPE